MKADFKFYNVGQGCFYGGAIIHNNKNFVVVYDCGTVTKGDPLKPAIQEFKQHFNHIDLLIISHFDQDHVNGIEELIKGIRVERIIMPYMPFWYRIVLIAKTSGDNEGYTRMLGNPTTYFLQGDFNIGNVYYIDQSPNGEGNPEINPESDPKFDRELNPDEEIGELNLEEPQEDEGTRQRILEEEPELENKNVSFLSADTTLRLGNRLWEFLFYHKQTKSQSDITNFQKAVESYMSAEGITKFRDLFSVKRKTVIKKLYIDHINKNINYSSLCLYHGPLFKAKVYGYEKDVLQNNFNRLFFLNYFYATGNTLKSGTLLTGDQFLQVSKDFDPFYNYFRTRMDKTLVFQVPHHGSLKNWKMMRNELNDHYIKCYVINCGYGRAKHPNKNVLQNILRFASPLIQNDEFKYFHYGFIPFKKSV